MLFCRSALELGLFIAACLFALVLAFVQPSFLFADDDSFRVRVLLELSQKQREKERVRDTGQPTPTRFVSYTDRDVAAAKAWQEGRPLVLWVGMTSGEAPALRKSLASAVHCLLEENRGDARPRVILVNPSDYTRGTTWHKSEIDDTTAAQILRAYLAQKKPAQAALPVVTYPAITPFSPCPGGVCPQP